MPTVAGASTTAQFPPDRWQLHENDICQLVLRVVGDSDCGIFPSKARPLMGLRILQFGWNVWHNLFEISGIMRSNRFAVNWFRDNLRGITAPPDLNFDGGPLLR